MSLPADLATLDGHTRTPQSLASIWLIYDRLTAYDAKLVPQPMLAESWELSSDFKQVKFNLRKGVQFHSGREFTSDDVKYNILRVRDPKVGSSQFLAQSNWFTTIATPDKSTVVLQSDQSRPGMFDFFENFNMLDKDTMEGPNAKTAAIGTGPFVFQEWAQGDHLTFTKNQNYWQAGRPYLDGLSVPVRQPQTAIQQIEASALDAVMSPSIGDIVRLKSDPTYAVVQHPNPGTFLELGVNVTKQPFDTKDLRQALNYAIDRRRLADQIYQGTSVAGALPWSPSAPAYDQAKSSSSFGFDLDKAKGLLQAAGITNLEMDMVTGQGNLELLTFLQAYQADLGTIGIKLNIDGLEAAAVLDQINNRKYNGMYASSDNNSNVSPSTLLNVSPGWKPDLPNNSGFGEDAWKQLVAAVSTEIDPAKQQQLYAQINDYVLDQSWIIPICSLPLVFLTRASVHGMTPTMHAGGFLFTDAWLGG